MQLLKYRFLFFVAFILALGVTTILRLAYVQLLDNDFLKDQGDKVVIRTEILPAHRGLIFDRNLEVLASSTPVASIWAEPTLVNVAHREFKELAGCLDRSPRDLRKMFYRYLDREFIYLKRQVSPGVSRCVEKLSLAGIHSRIEYRRYYPAAEVTAHVVGLTDIDDFGLEGAELAFEQTLKGIPGRKKVLRDGHGRNIRDFDHISEPRIGQDIVLSLDLRLQYIAYRELKRAVAKHQAKSGSIILLDATSGEVLALVNQPSYNPNANERSYNLMRNRALTDAFEPGSTVKPLIVATAISSQKYDKTSTVDTNPGFIEIGGKVIKDPMNYGVIDLKTIISKSSQVGIVRLARNLAVDEIFTTLTNFGFGRPTGLELPGEAVGKLPNLSFLSEIGKVTMAYGYGMAVTSAQLAQAYLTFANRGSGMQLSILKQDASSTTRSVSPSIIDDTVALDLLEMLESATQNSGTAGRANNHIYRTAGKTGTVRKVGAGGYNDQRHVALFAGIVPASEPRIVGVVVIDEPQGEVHSGGAVAAPVFSVVAVSALRLLDVRPDQKKVLL